MKGLLLKDWYVARKYCKLYFAVIVLMCLLSLVVDTGLWYLLYPILFSGMIPVYILSADEKWGWNGYAQCLPYMRRDIVTVKYLDALITVGATTVLMTLLWLGKFLLAGGGEGVRPLLRTMGLVFSVGLLFPMLMLPAMLRFGVEKGRFLMLAGVAVAMVVVVLVTAGAGDAPQGMQSLYAMDIVTRAGWRAPVILAVMLGALFLSWRLALRLYDKRDLK